MNHLVNELVSIASLIAGEPPKGYKKVPNGKGFTDGKGNYWYPKKDIVKEKLRDKLKTKVKGKWNDFSKEQKQFFEREDTSKERRSITNSIKDKVKGVTKAVKKEISNYKAAGKSLRKFVNGGKLEKEEKEVLMKVIKDVAINVAFIAATGGVLSAGSLLWNASANTLIQSVRNGVALGAVFASDEDNKEEDIADMILKIMTDGKISDEMWGEKVN